MNQMVCLTPEEISDYLQGRLPEAQCDTVEEHLSECESCDATAQQLDRPDDSLLRHLRLSPDPPVANEQWESCLDSLRSMPELIGQKAPSAGQVSLEKTLRPDSVYHYQLGRQLGRGGMGIVYQSWHPQLHRPVAIKILSAARATDKSSITRFQREMRAAGGLDHPGIVRAVDAGVWQGTYYLVMEFIDGVDLSRLVHRSGPLAVSDACAIVVQAAKALQFAHEHQVIHRDIKPSNLILTRDGEVKILDFGLARLEHGGLTNHDATTAGRLVGTLDYLAPEQAGGKDPIDARTDVYGLGATLFRLLTGRPPHGSSQNRPVLQYLQELTSDDPASAETYRADLAPKLVKIISQILSRDPEKRPPTAEQVAMLLSPFAEGAALETLASQVSIEEEDSPPESVGASIESTSHLEPVAETSPKSANPVTRPVRQKRFGGWPVLVGSLLVGLIGGWSGVTLWLNSGDASIQIESETDDISLQLVKDGTVAQEIEVHQGSKETRVRVGKYELRIAGDSDHVRLHQDSLSLMRGDQRIVRITRNKAASAKPETTTAKQEAAGESELTRSAIALNEILDKSQKEIDSQRKKYAPNHPEFLTAVKKHESVKQEIMRIVFGQDPDARTSRGRTYQQWTDIASRETDPKTVADAVGALASLSTDETHTQTFATLMKIAAWNELQTDKTICDSYIGFFTAEDELRAEENPRSPETNHLTNIYPPADDQWNAIVKAIVAAIKTLPEEVIAESVSQAISHGDESSKRILLIEAASNRNSQNQDQKDRRVRLLCKSDQPAQVRALANFIWLVRLNQTPNENQREALVSDSQPLARATLMALLQRKQYPFGQEMGAVSGSLIVAGVQHSFDDYFRALAIRSIEEGDAFRDSEEFKLLESSGAEIVRRWKTDGGSMIRLEGHEYIHILASAEVLNEKTVKDASKFLHSHLANQLALRSKIADASKFDDSSIWIMYSVSALTSLDGKLPGELEQYKMKAGTAHANQFNRWADDLRKGSTEAEKAITIWLVQYPLETVEVLFEIAANKIGEQSAFAQRHSLINSYTRVAPLFKHASPSLIVSYAAKHLDDENVQISLGEVLENKMNDGLSEFRLSIPLGLYVATFKKLATGSDDSWPVGMLLRLAQIGGADDAQIQKLAMKRIIAKRETDKESKNGSEWVATTHELTWLVECLSNAKTINITNEQFTQVNKRVIEAKYLAANSITTDRQRCILALLVIHERGMNCDPTILHIALRISDHRGDRLPRSSARSRMSAPRTNDELVWRMVNPQGSQYVTQQAIRSITKNPFPDPKIEKQLHSIQNRLTRANMGDRTPAKLIAKAQAAIQKVSKDE